MIRWNVIVVGCILVIVLKYIGSTSGALGSDFGVMIAGGIIGYLVDGDIVNGIVHGVLIGTVGASILNLIEIVNLQIYGLTSPLPMTYMLTIFSSSIFGGAGSGFITILGKLNSD